MTSETEVTPAMRQMQQPTRRAMLTAAMLAGSAAITGCVPHLAIRPVQANPAVRVIVDNDFGGDPDGLFMLSHLMLSPSVALPLVVGSQYRDFGEADLIRDKGAASARKANELLGLFPPVLRPPVIAGADTPIDANGGRVTSPASDAIIAEAMRGGEDAPLFYAAGGSLTELALALKAQPGIASRMTLVWIGGAEHSDLAMPPPGPAEAEYNFGLDRAAAQYVFNESNIEIWQIPRNAFRQMLVGLAEIDGLAGLHPIGRYLSRQVEQTEQRLAQNLPRHIFSAGETYMLGDTALVTLIALRTPFQADAASSSYILRPTPHLAADGSYDANPAGRPMRIYGRMDAALTWRDLVAKLRRLGGG